MMLSKNKRIAIATVVGATLLWFFCFLAMTIWPINVFSRPGSPVFVRHLFALENYNNYDQRLKNDLALLLPSGTSEQEVDDLLIGIAGMKKTERTGYQGVRIASYSRKLSGPAYQFRALASPPSNRAIGVEYNKNNQVQKISSN